jgi:hypothetical protein
MPIKSLIGACVFAGATSATIWTKEFLLNAPLIRTDVRCQRENEVVANKGICLPSAYENGLFYYIPDNDPISLDDLKSGWGADASKFVSADGRVYANEGTPESSAEEYRGWRQALPENRVQSMKDLMRRVPEKNVPIQPGTKHHQISTQVTTNSHQNFIKQKPVTRDVGVQADLSLPSLKRKIWGLDFTDAHTSGLGLSSTKGRHSSTAFQTQKRLSTTINSNYRPTREGITQTVNTAATNKLQQHIDSTPRPGFKVSTKTNENYRPTINTIAQNINGNKNINVIRPPAQPIKTIRTVLPPPSKAEGVTLPTEYFSDVPKLPPKPAAPPKATVVGYNKPAAPAWKATNLAKLPEHQPSDVKPAATYKSAAAGTHHHQVLRCPHGGCNTGYQPVQVIGGQCLGGRCPRYQNQGVYGQR